MRILITGATGFVGSNLVRDLCATTDHEVGILKRKNSDLAVLSSVCDQITKYTIDDSGENIYELVSEAKPDIVIHLATLFLGNHTPQQIEPLIQSNILFPTQLLDAMESCGVRTVINTGSFSECLDCKPGYDPVNLYSATKRSFEDILLYYVQAKNFRAVTLKLFDTYGPHDPRPKIFSLLKRSLREQNAIDLSPGGQLLDVIYIQDVVAAYKKAINFLIEQEGPYHESFFIGSGQNQSLKDIVDVFEDIAGENIPINWGGKPYREREIMMSKADIQKAQELLNWKPRFSLREGLKQMMTEESKI